MHSAIVGSGMKDAWLNTSEYARLMWNWRWIGIGAAWTLAAVFAVGLQFVHDRYESNARIYVDTQTVLKPLLAGLAFQPDIDQQVRMLARTLISRPNVEKLLDTKEIGLQIPPGQSRPQFVEKLMERIKVSPSGAGNLFTISYRDTDAERARQLVETLLKLFIGTNSDTKRRDSEDASRFINEQIKEYESKLTASENRLKDFKMRNFGVSGVSNQDYFSRMSALVEEVDRLRVQLTAAQQSRDTLRRELESENPQLPPEALVQAGVPPIVSELDQRLDLQRKQLDELLRRYTDEHPDVISVRRTISQLERQKRANEEAHSKMTDGKKGLAATSPIFQRIRLSLADAEASVSSLKSQLSAQQARLDQVRSMASRVPQAEAELAQLNRDYDVIRKNYDQLVARREAASLGVKIDESSGTAEFRLVEPPQVALRPAFPSRKLLAALSIVVATISGLVTTLLLARFVQVFSDTQTLMRLTGRPVLGGVSLQLNEALTSRFRRDRLRFGSAVAGFFVSSAVWLVWVATGGAA